MSLVGSAALALSLLLAWRYRRNFPPARVMLQRAAWALLAGLFVLGVPLYLLAWILAPP